MSTKSFFISFVFLGAVIFLVGCKTGEKKKFTDWSVPTVKLSAQSKDEKVTPPAEKANPQSTVNLAHDRLKGHNPTAAIRENDDDQTLRPNPQEIAKLNQFEGRQVPDWANTSLPPGPEAASPAPSERIAQNVPDASISAQDTGAIPSEITLPDAPSSQNSLSAQAVLNAGTSPSLPSSNGLPGTDSSVAPSSSNVASAAPVSPQYGDSGMMQAGAAMTELPDSLPGTLPDSLPGTASTVGANNGEVQVSAETPSTVGENTSGVAPAAARPAVLFMPGNINPNYPNGPSVN